MLTSGRVAARRRSPRLVRRSGLGSQRQSHPDGFGAGADIADERAGFRRRLGPEIGLETSRERIVRRERPGAVAGFVEKRDDARRVGLAVRRKGGSASRHFQCGRRVAGGSPFIGQLPRGTPGHPAQPRTLLLDPLIERRARVREKESVEKLARIHRQGVCRPTSLAESLERSRIDFNRRRIDTDFFIPASHHHRFAEDAPQKSQRLSQRTARMPVIELRPEYRDDGVATPESLRAGEREVGEQRAPLRLTEQRMHVPPICGAHIERAEGT
jgi:hypothetical protein